VWAIWITGVLQPSLPQDILLDLGLTEGPAMVARMLDLFVQRSDLVDQVYAPGTRLVDIFDQLDRALLILGAPGAGKTTLLLTLTQDLLQRAAQDPQYPLPVVFPLSSWANQRRPLANWLVDALSEQYDVPCKLGQAWIEADQVLPLLDGLDEVAPEHRAACVGAINTFRQEHGLLPLVVCSRIADYEALNTRLRLQGALVVQPLTRPQVESYLTQVGQPLAAVHQALQEDPTLWELLDTPLMLTITTLAYAGESVERLRTQGTPAKRRQHLFAAYMDRMFQRRSAITSYPHQRTERWLAWLAWQLAQRNQTVFYLERMQPDWLPQGQRWVPTQGAILMAALLGVLLGGLVFGLRSGLLGGLFGGLVGGTGWIF
jgi:GTPase SAR1 family protein